MARTSQYYITSPLSVAHTSQYYITFCPYLVDFLMPEKQSPGSFWEQWLCLHFSAQAHSTDSGKMLNALCWTCGTLFDWGLWVSSTISLGFPSNRNVRAGNFQPSVPVDCVSAGIYQVIQRLGQLRSRHLNKKHQNHLHCQTKGFITIMAWNTKYQGNSDPGMICGWS